jgi:hypothetical protein
LGWGSAYTLDIEALAPPSLTFPPGMKLTIERIAALPALAWAAEIRKRARTLHVVCGDAVEADDSGVIAGAWAGDFAGRGIAEAATSTGTCLRLTPQGLVAVVGTASTSPLHRWRGTGQARGRVVLSNSLALALAAAGDRLAPGYPFYPQVLYSIVLGPLPRRAAGGRRAAAGHARLRRPPERQCIMRNPPIDMPAIMAYVGSATGY